MQTRPPFQTTESAGGFGWWAGLITALLHGALAFSIWLGHKRGSEEVALLPRDFMVTKIVRLGKKRPPELLPHLTPPEATQPTAPTPPPPEPTPPPVEAAPPTPAPVPLGPEPVTPKAPTPAPPETKLATNPEAPADTKTPGVKKPKETTENAPVKDFRQSLAKARRLGAIEAQAEAEGDPDGDPDGNSDTASAGDIYATQIYRVYHQAWNIPDFAKAQHLAAQARIFVSRDGRILRAMVTRPSGNGPFDGSVEEVLNQVTKLPPPPADIALRVERSGLLLEFAP